MTTAKARAAQCRQETSAIAKLAHKTAMSCSTAVAILHPNTEDNDRCYHLVYSALVSGLHDIGMHVDPNSCREDADFWGEHISENYEGCELTQQTVKRLMYAAYEEYNKFNVVA